MTTSSENLQSLDATRSLCRWRFQSIYNHGASLYLYKGSLPIVSWGERTLNTQAALTDPVQELSKDHEQLWLVEIRPWEADPKGMVKAVLDERQQLVKHKAFPKVNIYLYQLRHNIS